MSAQGAQIKKDIEFSVHHNKTTNPPIQSVHLMIMIDGIAKILNLLEFLVKTYVCCLFLNFAYLVR